MTYTWQEIEQDGLCGGSGLAASPDEVVSAVNMLTSRFGREWVEAADQEWDGEPRHVTDVVHRDARSSFCGRLMVSLTR